VQKEEATRAFKEANRERSEYEALCQRTKAELDGRLDFAESQRAKKRLALKQRKAVEESMSSVHEEESAVSAELQALQLSLEEVLEVCALALPYSFILCFDGGTWKAHTPCLGAAVADTAAAEGRKSTSSVH
jgi:hypothetical protein